MPARTRRFRLTIRGMMIGVIVAGLGLAAWDRRERYRKLSHDYEAEASLFAMRERSALWGANQTREQWEAACREVERKNRDGVERSGGRRMFFMTPLAPEVERRKADYFGAMRRKYERAARHPWLSVDPDPPEPN